MLPLKTSTDIKLLYKAQISKIIQSGGSSGSWLGKKKKKALNHVHIRFARDNLPGLVSNIASNIINKFEEKKINGEGVVISRKDSFYSFQMDIWQILLKSSSHWKI